MGIHQIDFIVLQNKIKGTLANMLNKLIPFMGQNPCIGEYISQEDKQP